MRLKCRLEWILQKGVQKKKQLGTWSHLHILNIQTYHLFIRWLQKPFYQSNVQPQFHVVANAATSIQIVLCSDLQSNCSIRLHCTQLSMQDVASSSDAVKSQRPQKYKAEECILSEMPLLLFAPHPIECIHQGHHADGSTCRLYRWNEPNHRNHFTSINSPESFWAYRSLWCLCTWSLIEGNGSLSKCLISQDPNAQITSIWDVLFCVRAVQHLNV